MLYYTEDVVLHRELHRERIHMLYYTENVVYVYHSDDTSERLSLDGVKPEEGAHWQPRCV